MYSVNWITIQYGENMKEILIVENKEVKSNGNTGRVLVPKRYLGKKVNVYLLEENGDTEILENNNKKVKLR